MHLEHMMRIAGMNDAASSALHSVREATAESDLSCSLGRHASRAIVSAFQKMSTKSDQVRS